VVTGRKEEVGGAEAHEMDILGPHTSSAAGSLRSVSTGQDINDEAQSVVSQDEGVTSIWPCCRIPRPIFCSVTGSRGNDAPKMNITSDRLTQAEAQTRALFPHDCRGLNDLMTTKSATASNPTVDSGPRITASDLASEQKPEEPRMIGDFDGSSNALWTLFRDEAKSHDNARINTLKDDMDGVLIFVR
jgi:hypothetical protein